MISPLEKAGISFGEISHRAAIYSTAPGTTARMDGERVRPIPFPPPCVNLSIGDQVCGLVSGLLFANLFEAIQERHSSIDEKQ